MLLWASSFVALKLAFRGYHPMQVIFGRMLIASLCFVVFIPSFRKLNWRRQDVKYLLTMAVCEPCLYFLFEAKALELTSASQAGMITAMLPFSSQSSPGQLLKSRFPDKLWQASDWPLSVPAGWVWPAKRIVTHPTHCLAISVNS